MEETRFRKKLREGLSPLGIFLGITDPAVVEILGHTGFDFIVIDTEHVAFDLSDVQHLVRAAQVVGITPIVRVGENNPKLILRVMETGAAGIMVPHVKTPDDAEKAVRAVKYGPRGERSLHGGVRAADYGAVRLGTHLETSNRETIVIVQIEEKEAVELAPVIARVPDVDSLFIGPFDLSASYGVPGKIRDPKVVEAASTVVRASHAAGVYVGHFVIRIEDVEPLRKAGVQYFVYMTDLGLLVTCCRRAVEAYHNIPSTTGASCPGTPSTEELVTRITQEVLRRLKK
jgi:4-hydroxy-2-oxoheptanedioate aldolase